MEKILYLSNYSRERTDEFYNSFLEDIKKSRADKVYYILPNGRLINYYREKVLEDLGGSFSLNFYTFDDIVNSSLEEEEVIDDQFKKLIISRILDRLDRQGQLIYYKDMLGFDGFISSLIDIISSLKKDLIRSQDFLDQAKTRKYFELGLIYQAYENYLLDNELLDRDETYFKFMDLFKDGPGLGQVEKIYIDEFFDFRPIELKLLEILSDQDIQIYINIANQLEVENKIIENTKSQLRDLGFSLKETSYKMKPIGQLAHQVFSKDKTKLQANIQAIVASSKYLEVKKVFQEIKKDLNNGMDLKAIGIVILSEEYLDIIAKINQEEKLPLNENLYSSLIWEKLIEEILNILKLGGQGDFKSLLLNRLESKYFSDLDLEKSNRLLSLIRNQDLTTREDLKKLIYSREISLVGEDLQLLTRLENILAELEELESLASIIELNDYLRSIFLKYGLETRLMNLWKVDLEEFGKASRIYQELNQVFGDMEYFAAYENQLSLEAYIDLLEDFFHTRQLVDYRRRPDGIRILSLINNRGFNFKNLYILGLGQDCYPSIRDGNFLFQDRNQEDLIAMGLNYKSYDIRLDNEIAKFSRSLSSASEKVVLSYSKGQEGENPSSIFYDEVSKRVEGFKVSSIDYSYIFKEDFNTISNQEEYLNYILLNQKNLDLAWDYSPDRARFKKLNQKLKSEVKRAEGASGYSGLLQDPSIRQEIRDYYGDYEYSATSLDVYGACPFKFFLQYVLGLEEIYQEEGEDFLGMGRLYHLVLRDFYRDYYRRDFQLKELPIIVSQLFEKYRAELGLKSKSSLDRLYLESKEEKLLDFIGMDLARINSQALEPTKFEFGLGKNFKLGATKLRGQIDRLDRLEDKSVVIDYKSGQGPGLKRMEEGLSFQMPIYIMSQQALKPVAGLYGNLAKTKYDLAFGLENSVEEVKGKRSGKFNSQEEMLEFLDQVGERINQIRLAIMDSNFSLEPKECMDYCIYKNICRYGAGD